MPSVSFPASSLLSFFGASALLLGFFLFIAGLRIIKIDKITVYPGKKTWVTGFILILLGSSFLYVDKTSLFSSSPTNNAIPTIGPLRIYDDFNNVAYDRVLNTNLWHSKLASTCTVFQMDGYLKFANELNKNSTECRIVAGNATSIQELGTTEAEIKMLNDVKGGPVNQGITFEKTSTPSLYAFCGIAASPDSIGLAFDVTSDGKSLIYQGTPAEFDRSYKFQLAFDYKSMQFNCFASEKLIGSISVSSIPDFKNALFERQITGWRDSSTLATAIVDNVKIGMP